jgi:hypothetical protein
MEAHMNAIHDRGPVLTRIVGALAILFFVPSAFGQGWIKYRSERDGFEAEIPPGAQVSIVETTWQSWTGFTLPSRIYTFEHGRERYSVTVADYTDIEELGKEKLRNCPPNLEICVGTPLSGAGYWKHDLRGTQIYATSTLIKRENAKVMDMSWDQISRVSTTQVSLLNTSDESRTYALVTMNQRLLYIAEATVPKGAPSPVRFGGSFSLISRNGARNDGGGFAYPSLYSNEIYGVGDIPPPPPAEGTEGGARPYRPDEFN